MMDNYPECCINDDLSEFSRNVYSINVLSIVLIYNRAFIIILRLSWLYLCNLFDQHFNYFALSFIPESCREIRLHQIFVALSSVVKTSRAPE